MVKPDEDVAISPAAMAQLDDFLAEWDNGADYIVAHTSGSTGKPKEIRLLKSDMRASARATNAFFGIGKGSTIGMALSPDYIAGKMMAVRALESGAALVPLKPCNDICLDGFEGVIDLLAIVPSQCHNFIGNPQYSAKVRRLLIGGAAPTADQCLALSEARYKVSISYGMTETCSHVALADGDDPDRVFRAMPGITFSATADCRLIVNAPHFSFRSLETNDVVDLLSPTAFRWRGRADGAINSGALKFFPEELEALYSDALPALRYYVTSQPDGKWGQAVTLVVEGKDTDTGHVADALRRTVADRRRLPKHIITVERLPMASNGKIRRLTPDKL